MSDPNIATELKERSKAYQILDKVIDSDKDSLIKDVQNLVRIKSVEGTFEPGAPFGPGPANALNRALQMADRLGFKTVNLAGYAGFAETGTGSEYVAVLGHVDVVPEGDGWIYPPYGAEIHDGRIYGRGTTDDKGPIVACLYALKAVRDSKLPISRRVRIIFGTNEETTNADIPYYLDHEPAPVWGFTPDAFYPLVHAEKGIVSLDLVKDLKQSTDNLANETIANETCVVELAGGTASNIVPSFAKAVVSIEKPLDIQQRLEDFSNERGYSMSSEIDGNSITISSFGVAAHASIPHEGKNGIMQLLSFLSFESIGSSDLLEAVDFMYKRIGMETDGRSLGICLKDDESGDLTLNVGLANISKGKVSFTLNIRYPVTFELDDVVTPIKKAISGTGLQIENLSHQSPLYYPLDSPLVSILQGVYRNTTGDSSPPLAIGGGTYAKEMPNVLAFGPIFPGKPMVEHKPDEYIEIDDLMKNVRIYARAIYELSR